MTTIAKRIKDLRKSKDYTQTDMTNKINAKGIKLGRTGYQAYESGRVEPPRKVLSIIADILETDVNYLIGRMDSQEYINSNEIPDIKKQFDFILCLLETKEELTYGSKPVNETMRKVLITSIEQTTKVAATLADEGKKSAVAGKTQ